MNASPQRHPSSYANSSKASPPIIRGRVFWEKFPANWRLFMHVKSSDQEVFNNLETGGGGRGLEQEFSYSTTSIDVYYLSPNLVFKYWCQVIQNILAKCLGCMILMQNSTEYCFNSWSHKGRIKMQPFRKVLLGSRRQTPSPVYTFLFIHRTLCSRDSVSFFLFNLKTIAFFSLWLLAWIVHL